MKTYIYIFFFFNTLNFTSSLWKITSSLYFFFFRLIKKCWLRDCTLWSFLKICVITLGETIRIYRFFFIFYIPIVRTVIWNISNMQCKETDHIYIFKIILFFFFIYNLFILFFFSFLHNNNRLLSHETLLYPPIFNW